MEPSSEVPWQECFNKPTVMQTFQHKGEELLIIDIPLRFEPNQQAPFRIYVPSGSWVVLDSTTQELRVYDDAEFQAKFVLLLDTQSHPSENPL